jgi:hypothetical protein
MVMLLGWIGFCFLLYRLPKKGLSNQTGTDDS